jgi:transposase
MAEQTNLVQEGVDRFNAAFESLGDEVDRLQRQMKSRRKSIEKQLTDRRKRIEKRTRKQVDRIESELRKSPVMKRLQRLRKDVVHQIESRVDSVMDAVPIATKSDLKRVERRISQLSRKLKDLERGRKANGEGSHI